MLFLHRGPLLHAMFAYPSGRISARFRHGVVVVGYAEAVIQPLGGNPVAALALSTLVASAAVYGYMSDIGPRRRAGAARERLKTQFNATLPRFDVMAALYRKPEGMLMSEISRFLMVSNGNVTGIVDRLVSDGFVVRSQRNGDRRTSFINLTRKGRLVFAEMAQAHEKWVDELLGSVSARDADQLSAKLKSFRSEWEGGA